MSAAIWNEPPAPSLMTLRVSRDGGRTFGPVREIRADDRSLSPLDVTSAWPPCQCPRHRNGMEITR